MIPLTPSFGPVISQTICAGRPWLAAWSTVVQFELLNCRSPATIAGSAADPPATIWVSTSSPSSSK
jgi:hypothetical protein